jgi:hypothetical protein
MSQFLEKSAFGRTLCAVWIVLFLVLLIASGPIGRWCAGMGLPWGVFVWLMLVLIGWPAVLFGLIRFTERHETVPPRVESPLEKYLYEVDVLLEKLPLELKACFSAACLQRMLPLYERACSEYGYPHLHLINSSLNAIWERLIHQTPVPDSLVRAFDDLFPDDPDQFNEWDPKTEIEDMGRLFMVEANEIMVALRSPQKTWPTIHHEALQLIDYYADSWSGTEVTTIEQELVELEIARQRADLSDLQQSANVQTFARLRERATGQNVLGSEWFSGEDW